MVYMAYTENMEKEEKAEFDALLNDEILTAKPGNRRTAVTVPVQKSRNVAGLMGTMRMRQS